MSNARTAGTPAVTPIAPNSTCVACIMKSLGYAYTNPHACGKVTASATTVPTVTGPIVTATTTVPTAASPTGQASNPATNVAYVVNSPPFVYTVASTPVLAPAVASTPAAKLASGTCSAVMLASAATLAPTGMPASADNIVQDTDDDEFYEAFRQPEATNQDLEYAIDCLRGEVHEVKEELKRVMSGLNLIMGFINSSAQTGQNPSVQKDPTRTNVYTHTDPCSNGDKCKRRGVSGVKTKVTRDGKKFFCYECNKAHRDEYKN